MGATLTRGVWQLRAVISAYLADKMPDFIDQARVDWGLSALQLPYPAKYDVIDPDVVNNGEYPFIGAEFPSDDNWIRTDYTDTMEEEYWSTYTATIFTWVTTPKGVVEGTWEHPEWDTTVRLRDDMLELLRQCLLWQQDLGSPGNCKIEENTVRCNRLAPIKSNNQGWRFFAGGIVSLQIRFRSELSRVKLGNANTINLEEFRVAVGEPMP